MSSFNTTTNAAAPTPLAGGANRTSLAGSGAVPLGAGASSGLPGAQQHLQGISPAGNLSGATPAGSGLAGAHAAPLAGTGLAGHQHGGLGQLGTQQQGLAPLTNAATPLAGGSGLAGSHATSAPLAAGAATGLGGRQHHQGLGVGGVGVGRPEQVIHHAPIVEKEIVHERPVEVRREHHVQPVIHEREHRIQPVIRTQTTTERPVIEQERSVVLPPVVEKTTLGSGLAGPGLGGLDAERRLASTTGGAPLMSGDRYGTTGLGHTAAPTAGHHATVGQKIKGTAKEVAGTITRNPAKKEEGKMLKHGVDPATASTTGATGLNTPTTGF